MYVYFPITAIYCDIYCKSIIGLRFTFKSVVFLEAVVIIIVLYQLHEPV